MDEPGKQEVQRVFHEALEVPLSERGAFLEEACRGDDELQARVEKLLVAHEKAGSFLSTQEGRISSCALTDAVSARCLREPEPRGHAAGHHSGGGRRIGPYKLLEEIGEGGFGTVYRAEQQEPVRREVALKLVKLGMDTKQVVARFDAERQALAMMAHPNIATVLDAGATDTGRPYFVMELVRGVRITEYCDSARLNVPERLRLFVRVCRALQHAHQKGVIHRDVKPSNILVTLREGSPVPKVIDFGIAKATGVGLHSRSISTELWRLVGTPEYMSPEQAEPSKLDIDTRSDIYSLGVLLYELLTGTTPFSAERLREKGYGEIHRIIGEDEPETPSSRVASLRREEATAIAQNRKLEPRVLARLLHGELDWIVMKALEKDRGKRYGTAAGFALDVERYLSVEPVEAGPPSRLYRLRKFVRRNRAVAVAGVLVSGSLFVGGGLATYGFFQATQESQRARASEAQATREAEKAHKIVDLLQRVFRAADPYETRDPEYKVREALDDFVRDLGDELSDEPEVEAALRTTIGSAYAGLGRYEEAVAHCKRALDIRRKLLGEQHPETLEDMSTLGRFYTCAGRHADAEPLLVRALDAQRRVLGEDHEDTLLTMNHLASLYGATERCEMAERLAKKALSVARRVFGEESGSSLVSMKTLGHLYWREGRFEEAEHFYARALEAERRRHGTEHPCVSVCMNNLAMAYRGMRRYADAERLFKETLEIERRILGGTHPGTLHTLDSLAGLYHEAGRHGDEEPIVCKVLEIRTHTLGEEHRETLATRIDVGRVYIELERFGEAAPLLESALELARRALGKEDRLTLNCMHNLADVYDSTGRLAAAEDLYLETLEAKRRVLGEEDEDTVSTAVNLGNLYKSQGRFGESEPLLVRALESRRRVLGEEHRDTLTAANNLASLYTACGRYAEAERLHRKVLESRQRLFGEEHPDTLRSMSNLGHMYWRQRRFAEAELLFEKALKLRRRVLGEAHPDTAGSMHNLASLYLSTGRKAEAENLFREALVIEQRTLGEEHELTLSTMHGLGLLCGRRGRFEESCSLLEKVLEVRRRMLGNNNPSTLAIESSLAEVYARQCRYPRAAELFTEALEGRRKVYGEKDPQTLETMTSLGGLFVDMGEGHLEKAEPLLLKAYQLRREVLGARHSGTLTTGSFLALLYRRTGRYAEAEPLMRESLEAAKRDHGEGYWAVHVVGSVLGECLTAQGKFEEAESLLLEACNGLDESPPPADAVQQKNEVLARIVKLYEAWEKAEEAEEWRAKLEATEKDGGP